MDSTGTAADETTSSQWHSERRRLQLRDHRTRNYLQGAAVLLRQRLRGRLVVASCLLESALSSCSAALWLVADVIFSHDRGCSSAEANDLLMRSTSSGHEVKGKSCLPCFGCRFYHRYFLRLYGKELSAEYQICNKLRTIPQNCVVADALIPRKPQKGVNPLRFTCFFKALLDLNKVLQLAVLTPWCVSKFPVAQNLMYWKHFDGQPSIPDF